MTRSWSTPTRALLALIVLVAALLRFTAIDHHLRAGGPEFDERNNEIRLKTFSPYVASLADEQRSYLDVKFLTGPGDQYEIAFHFAERFDFTAS